MCGTHRHPPSWKDITMFVNLTGHSWFTSADRKQDLYNTDQYCPKTFAIEDARLRHFSLSVYHDTNVFWPVLPGQWWICWQEKTNKFCCWETCCPWFVSADMPTCWPIHFLFTKWHSVFPFSGISCLLHNHTGSALREPAVGSLQGDWHSRAKNPIYNFQKNLWNIELPSNPMSHETYYLPRVWHERIF